MPVRSRKRTDPDRIEQVWWNLVSNALRFTPSGGEIVCSVADNGTGIVSADQSRFFFSLPYGPVAPEDAA